MVETGGRDGGPDALGDVDGGGQVGVEENSEFVTGVADRGVLAGPAVRLEDAGEWLPGEQMPSTTVLATEYKVSRTTAARALRVLADEGRVTIVRNWGTFVADPSAQ